MELRNKILEGTIQVFNEKGLKFTMDDIARLLGISKKTIYTVFKNKEDLFLIMVDYLFDSIKESEEEVMEDNTLTTLEKLRKILGVLPERYKDVNFQNLHILEDKYPKTYKKLKSRIETGWDSTFYLLEEGIKEGVVKPIKIPIFKMMFESSLEQFFKRDILIKNDISYKEGLDEVVNILIDGIIK